MSAVGPRPPGMPCWLELGGPARADVLDFWGAALAWTYDENAAVGGYRRSHAGGAKVAGFGGPPDPTTPRGWRVYLHVDDLDRALAGVDRLGGTVVHPVTAAGPDGRFAWIRDPEGTATGLFEPHDDPGTAREPGPGRVCGWTLESERPEVARGFYGALFGDFERHVDVGIGDRGWVVSVRAAGSVSGDLADPAGNRLRVVP